MSVFQVAVSSPNSVFKTFKQEANRVITFDDINVISGTTLEGSQLRALILMARALMDQWDGSNIYLGFRVASWDGTTITTTPGLVITTAGIFYYEGLVLTPTNAGYYGLFELEFDQAPSDSVGKDFIDPLAETITNAPSNTRMANTLNVYELYSTTASYPNPTTGRITLLFFQKQASLQPIVKVIPALRSPGQSKQTKQIVSTAEVSLESVFGEEISGRYELWLESDPCIEATLHWNGTDLRVVSSSTLVSGVKDTAGNLNLYVGIDGSVKIQNNLGALIKVIFYRRF